MIDRLAIVIAWVLERPLATLAVAIVIAGSIETPH